MKEIVCSAFCGGSGRSVHPEARRCIKLGLAMACAVSFHAAVAREPALEQERLWPQAAMPDRQQHQIAAMKADAEAKGFDRAAHTEPYLEWSAKPAQPNGICLITISGGGYGSLCCHKLIERWRREYAAFGCRCVNLVYRSPRPKGLPIYQSAWEDGQRAVRLVRAAAARRGYDPERIGVIGMSAGGHLAALLATRSQTRAAPAADELDRTVPCHVNFALVCALPFALSDGLVSENAYGGNLRYATFDDLLTPDAKTPPVCFFHGAADVYSPLADLELYRRLRARKIPAELHLYADHGHCGIYSENCFEEGAGFLRQLNLDRRLGPQESLERRFADVPGVRESAWISLWPAGRTPDVTTNQCAAEIKWFVPRELKTKAIQIVYSGGGYGANKPDSEWDGTRAARRFLNARGMAVVAMRYRTPRPFGKPKHLSAWQDVQRAVRLVRGTAAQHGLDGAQIGLLGGSAGGHLTLLGATSSLSKTYAPIDAHDKLSCSVQWAIACYPAYVLADGADGCNRNEGNGNDDRLVNDFAFDRATAPMLFLHGDSDGYAAMGSVRCWERLREIGVSSTVHTYVTRGHCFMVNAAPQTGSYNWLNRIWDFLSRKKIVK